MTKRLVVFCMVLSFVFLSAGWAFMGNWQMALYSILLLPVSLILWKRKFTAALNLDMVLVVGLAAFGTWRGLNFLMAFSAVLMIMAAWDLESFSRRLVFASVEDQPQAIERKHLEQLGLTLGLGLAVSLVSQSIRLAFSFEWAVVLAVVTFIGLGALVRRLRMKER